MIVIKVKTSLNLIARLIDDCCNGTIPVYVKETTLIEMVVLDILLCTDINVIINKVFLYFDINNILSDIYHDPYIEALIASRFKTQLIEALIEVRDVLGGMPNRNPYAVRMSRRGHKHEYYISIKLLDDASKYNHLFSIAKRS